MSIDPRASLRVARLLDRAAGGSLSGDSATARDKIKILRALRADPHGQLLGPALIKITVHEPTAYRIAGELVAEGMVSKRRIDRHRPGGAAYVWSLTAYGREVVDATTSDDVRQPVDG